MVWFNFQNKFKVRIMFRVSEGGLGLGTALEIGYCIRYC